MMHYGYDNGGGHWGLWVLMIVAMIVFWGAIIVTLIRHRGVPPGSQTTPPAPANTPPPRMVFGFSTSGSLVAKSMRTSTRCAEP